MANAPQRLVWATRPAHQNAAWQTQLSALGPEVIALPLLDIVPLAGDDETQRIKQHVLKLDEYQHVLFVSQNAVAEAFRWFEDYWPQLPVGIHYYGVGAKTAKAIAAFGVPVLEAGAAMNSEALLALPELKDVQDSKILICRGQGGSILSNSNKSANTLSGIRGKFGIILPVVNRFVELKLQ